MEPIKATAQDESRLSKGWVPKRHIVVGMCALATLLQYTIRVNLSVTIVAMVNHTALRVDQGGFIKDLSLNQVSGCPKKDVYSFNSSMTSSSDDRTLKNGPFKWSPSTQGIILGAFYYGYILTHVNGGQLADLCGSKLIIGVSLFTSSILTLLTPITVQFHVVYVILLRILTGMSQGLLSPAIYTLYGKWIPATERSTAIAYFNVGANAGTVVMMLASGILCEHTFLGGWPSVFYTTGTVGLLCFLLWCYAIYDSPDVHPTISVSELDFLSTRLQNGIKVGKQKQSVKVPWMKIMLCKHMWFIALAKFSTGWAQLLLMSKLPAYLESVHHQSLQTNGLINAIVYITISISITAFGYLSDYITKRDCISRTLSRKVFECVALLGGALCIVSISLVGCQTEFVILLLILSMVCFGANAGGDSPIVMDIAPSFSGSLYGITNAIGSLPGFVAPVVVGLLIDKNPGSIERWNYVFYLTAVILVVGCTGFLFVSAEEQPWGQNQVKDVDSPQKSQKDATNIAGVSEGNWLSNCRHSDRMLTSHL